MARPSMNIPPVLDHIGVIGRIERAPGILLDREYDKAATANAPRRPKDLRDDRRIKPQARLVKQQEPRPADRRPADLARLPHAPAVRDFGRRRRPWRFRSPARVALRKLMF